MAIPIYSWVEVIGPSVGGYTHDMGRRGRLNEITGEGNYFFGESGFLYPEASLKIVDSGPLGQQEVAIYPLVRQAIEHMREVA